MPVGSRSIADSIAGSIVGSGGRLSHSAAVLTHSIDKSQSYTPDSIDGFKPRQHELSIRRMCRKVRVGEAGG